MKKLYTVITAVIIAAMCLFLFTGCGEETYTIDGVEVSDIRVIDMGGGFLNFRMKVKNDSKEDKYLDAKKLTLQLSDGAGLPHYGGVELCLAQSEDELSFMIEGNHPNLKIGDKIVVFNDGKKLCEIELTDTV